MDGEITKLKDLPENLVKYPYETIRAWAEKRFKLVGGTVFSYLSFLPISVFIPKINYEDTKLPTGINFLLLTPPSGAKSIINDAMEEICINPVNVDKVSAPELLSELSSQDFVTLTTGDAGRIFRDKELIKSIEMIIYDGKVRKRNKREWLNYELRANGFFAGTPQDLTGYLGSGMLSRLTPMVLMHQREEQNEIGKGIVNSLGNHIDNNIKIDDIRNYYKFLFQLQKGDIPKFKKIKGYYLTDLHKKVLYNAWVRWRDEAKTLSYENYYRELISGFKYLFCSSFLNLPNRRVENGMIYPNKEDLKIATTLLFGELNTKIFLMRSEKIASQIRDIRQLEKISEQNHFNKITEDTIKMFIQPK